MSDDAAQNEHRDAIEAAAEVCDLLAESERHRAARQALIYAARLIRGLYPKADSKGDALVEHT